MAHCDGWLSTTDGVTPDARPRRMAEHRRPRVTFAPSRCGRRDGGGTRLEVVLGRPRRGRPNHRRMSCSPPPRSAVQTESQSESTTSIAAQQRRSTEGTPKVGRDRRSFAGERRARPSGESNHRRASPTAGPIPEALAPSIVTQQPRSSVSTPQRRSPPPIISLIPPGGNAHYGCPRPGPTFILHSTEPSQLRHGRAEYSHPSKRRSGEARPSVGPNHRSFRLVSHAHDISEAWLACMFGSTEPSLLPRASPCRCAR
jgi:hypothetical protein